MRAQFLLCVIVLLILKQVASSDVIVQQKPVLSGQDIHLRIPTPDLIQRDTKRLKWEYNGDILLEYTFQINHLDRVFPKHNERQFTFSEADNSLLLKNLRKMDSGLYEAVKFITADTSIVKYNVIVQDNVSPVNLTVVSKFSGLDSCNVTVTCSSENSSVNNTFTCDNNQHCSPEGGESSQVRTSTGLLSVYMSEGFINCSHSNLVSSLKEITPLCQLVSGDTVTTESYMTTSHSGGSSISYIVGILVGCICGTVVIIAILYYIRRHRGNANIDNRMPNSTYLVQHPSGSVPAATTETTINTTNTENTLYAQVQKKPARR